MKVGVATYTYVTHLYICAHSTFIFSYTHESIKLLLGGHDSHTHTHTTVLWKIQYMHVYVHACTCTVHVHTDVNKQRLYAMVLQASPSPTFPRSLLVLFSCLRHLGRHGRGVVRRLGEDGVLLGLEEGREGEGGREGGRGTEAKNGEGNGSVKRNHF